MYCRYNLIRPANIESLREASSDHGQQQGSHQGQQQMQQDTLTHQQQVLHLEYIIKIVIHRKKLEL